MTDARAWLARKRHEIDSDDWKSPRKLAPVTFGVYAREHVDTRTNTRGERLKPRTREEYLRLIAGPLEPFEDVLLPGIQPEDVRRWYSGLVKSGKLTQAGHAYRLLKSIMATAESDGHAELAIIVATIDPRLSLMVEIAAWGGLRWGELTELRRGDVLFQGDVVTLAVARAVTYTKSTGYVVGVPKSFAGIRTLALPKALTAPLRDRLAKVGHTDDALLFPSLGGGGHMSSGAFATHWRRARAAAGRDDMPFHALRHFGATRYAMAGATAKELMRRMGHNDVAVAMRYQHDAGRDAELVDRMS